jgi:hypothetical protein
MAQNVEARARGDGRRQVARVVRVDDAHDRPQAAVGDAGLGVHFGQVEDRHAGRLTAGARGRRDRDQRLEPAGDRLAATNRRIDICEKIRRVRGVQVGRFGRVHARAAAHGHVAIEAAIAGEADGLLERGICWLDAHLVEQLRVQAGGAQRRERHRDRFELCQARIGDDHHPRGAQRAHVLADLTRCAGSELDAGGIHRKDGLIGHAAHLVSRLSAVPAPCDRSAPRPDGAAQDQARPLWPRCVSAKVSLSGVAADAAADTSRHIAVAASICARRKAQLVPC